MALLPRTMVIQLNSSNRVVIANTAALLLRQEQLIVRRAANPKAMFLSSVLNVL